MSSLLELHPGTGIGPSAGTLEPSLDVVAIHGLNPLGHENHAVETWEDKTSGNLWLRDRIPPQLPNARIFLYQYNSSPVFGISQERFVHEANDFLERLRLKRRNDPKRPLILLGHSLGGILIKQALVNAYTNPIYRDIQEATYGLIFFGTPHGGPGVNWKSVFGKTCVKIAQSIPGKASNDIMEALKRGSLFSDVLQNQWRHQLKSYQIVTFYEGIGDVVPRDSACLGLGGDHESQLKIEAKHGDMCRFNPKFAMDENNYDVVEGNMVELCEKAATQLGTSLHNHAMDSKVKDMDLQLSKLRLAESASFDSMRNQHEPRCIDGTRIQLLQELQEWSSNPQRPIFWLSGMAGTGKSTITHTMAHWLDSRHKLAGSFFFRRGGGDLEKAAKFVTTLAHQLANFSNPDGLLCFKESVCGAITDHSNVLLQGLRNQWTEFVVEPLSRISSTRRLSLTFVIDALDECDSTDDIRLIIQLFIEFKNITNMDLSVLITSRPEIALKHGFQGLPEIMHRRLDLRDIPREIVEHDIYVFMKEKLRQIESESNGQPWPTESDLEALVRKADCLFIYAATVCRFIGSFNDVPEDCVSNILLNKPTGGGDTAAIDAMYTQVLSNALAKPEQRKTETERLTERFKTVVGSIVVLSDMLSVTTLANLLSMKFETTQITLGTLGSVLDIPNDTERAVRLLHPSFRDFLLSEARCEDERFHVKRETAHTYLAIRCLDIMCEGLRRNICNLESPGSSPQEVSKHALNRHLPRHVQYACQYWTEHLACACSVDTTLQHRSQLGLCDDGKIHEFFKGHFLYWLESMSLLGKMPEVVLMMKRLLAILELNHQPLLHAIVKDAERFVLRNSTIMQQAPLQTYASALVFSPRQSQIRKQNLTHYPRWFKGGPAVEDHWGINLQTLEHPAVDDRSPKGCVAFSFDGNYLASSLGKTIILWNPTTGTRVGTLEGHRASVVSITSSRKGQLASASIDGEVRIWDPVTGVTCRTLKSGSHDYRSKDVAVAVAFAPDGTLAHSYDDAVRIWNIEDVALPVPVNPKLIVPELAFLSDGNLAMVSRERESKYEREIFVYDPRTKTKRIIASPRFHDASFSSNDHVALTTYGEAIRVYNLRTGSYQSLRADSGSIKILAFSSSNESLFACYYDGTIYHWNLKSGTRTPLGNFPGSLSSITSSPDSKLAIVLSYGKEVRLLDVASILLSPHRKWPRNRNQIRRGSLSSQTKHGGPITLLEFSGNGKQLASASLESILTFWNPATQREIHVLQHHEHSIWTIKFSMTGNYLASGGYNGTVQIWVPTSGQLLKKLKDPSVFVTALAFSPNDEILVSANGEGEVKIWDSKTWHLQHTLDLKGEVQSIAFSQNGKSIAYLYDVITASNGREIQIWDAIQHIHLRTLHNLRMYMTEIIFFAESYIDTGCGRIQLEQSPATLLEETDTPVERWKVHDDWLFHDGQKMLWLPPDFRASCTAIYDDLFVLGHWSGKLTFFDGNTDDSTLNQAMLDPAN